MVIQKIISRKFAIAFLSLLCAFGMGRAAAETALQAVVQSYTASSSLQRGMIVKLVDKNGTKVEPATLETADKMNGVVVSPSEAAITLSSQTSDDQTYVATSGRYQALVSDQNGDINTGDYVTISSLDGVGMKADAGQQQVLGKALGSFDGSHNVKSSTTVKNSSGKTIEVKLGLVPVDIAIAPNPVANQASNIPGFLQQAGRYVSNKPVSPWRTYVGLVILIGSLLVSGSLLYGGVRNGMVAIGRNPLAKQSIMGNLIQVVTTSIVIFVIGLVAVYLLLRL